METFVTPIRFDVLSEYWRSPALSGAAHAFVVFTLVAARVAGLFILGPVFGHPGLTVKLRGFLIVAIALVLTPALLVPQSQAMFEQLDQNGDHRLELDETPSTLQPQVRQMLDTARKPEQDGLARHEFQLSFSMPRTILEYLAVAVMELGTGLALGLGMTTILSALVMAGSLIDQQLGFSTGELLHAESGMAIGLNGQLLHQLGLVAFLAAGGHLLLIATLLETYQSLPVGFAWITPPVTGLLSDLVQQSFALTLRIAAPVATVMGLVSLFLGFLARSLPQLNLLAVGIPVRVLLGLLVVGLSLESIVEATREILPETLIQLRRIVGSSVTP